MIANGNGIVIQVDDPALRQACDIVCRLVGQAGGRALLVGGCVRDSVLGLPARDLDFEVYGIRFERLIKLLSRRFSIEIVGRVFGVIKVRGLPIDISTPRCDSEIGLAGGVAHVTPEEAASRRDFTVNAIALDPLTGEVVDPFRGVDDLRRRILRHTTGRFAEDVLRVLRGMQFAARFDLKATPETLALCRNLNPEGLAKERVFEEWRKLILLASSPSRGLVFLRKCGWVRYYPELEALIDCPQDPKLHPEGDVWVHTLHCMDAFAAKRTGDKREDLVVGLAVLCHDFGKPGTTEARETRISSQRHELLGAELTRVFLSRMTDEVALIEDVVPLVGAHLAPVQLFAARATDAAVRRLARRVRRIDRLVRVAQADHAGRACGEADRFAAGKWLLERARALDAECAVPKPIVMGRHLIDLGLIPGPGFRSILETCYAAQIDGEFSTLEEGLEYARTQFSRKNPR